MFIIKPRQAISKEPDPQPQVLDIENFTFLLLYIYSEYAQP